jgi:PAS domain S-box-containing protein
VVTDADRFGLLAAVGEVADGALSLAETEQRLLDCLVPAFADVAVLDGLRESGERYRLAARADGPDRAELERTLMERAPARTGEARLIAEEELHLGLRAGLFVPLQARSRTLGMLGCAVGASGRTYDDGDLRFAQVLAGRIALALENAGLSAAVSALQQQLEATLANLAEAVIVRAADGRMVFTNDAAARLLGVGSVEQLQAARAEELMALYEAYDEDGRPLTLADLPSARAQRGELPGPLVVRNVVRAGGAERWLRHKATPVFGADGELSLVVNVIEDVTEVKRAELGQRLLAQAGKELSSSLDYGQTLQRVARLAVPELADWCGVAIVGRGAVLEQVAVAHVDPGKVALARAFGERYPARLSDPTGAAEVIRTGRAQLVPEVTEEMIAGAELSKEQREFIRELQMNSVIIVPLTVAGRPPLGALTLVMAESGRRFDPDDLALAEELGRRAATAVENARIYTERSEIAATLQRGLLPPELPAVPGFALAGMYRAAGDQNEVGGDFYDAFDVAGGWMVVVGDVAGRGAEAATLTSLSRHTLRTAGRLLGDPLAAVAELNTALLEQPAMSLVTVACALLREEQATLVLAGQPPPYVVRGGEATPVGTFGAPLGVDARGPWSAATVDLLPGDQLVLYTDGVTDTVGDGERFGEARLAEALRAGGGAADTVGRIEAALGRFARGPQVDDTAVLVVERYSESSRRTMPATGIGTQSGRLLSS